MKTINITHIGEKRDGEVTQNYYQIQDDTPRTYFGDAIFDREKISHLSKEDLIALRDAINLKLNI